MAGISLDVRINDLDLQRGLRARFRAASDLSPAMDEIGEMLVSSVIERFEREEDPDGKPWEKSARASAEGGQTLTDTAILKGSITHDTHSFHVDVGSVEKYSAIHQFGGTIRPTNGEWLLFQVQGKWCMVREVEMPQRAYLGINAQDNARAIAILARHLEAL